MAVWQTPQPLRAVFFDADGTLLSFQTHEVPDSAVQALRALRERGVRTFLCTGRSPSLLDDVPLDLFDACLTMSGQYCYVPGQDGAADDVFLSKPISADDMRAVVLQVDQGLYHCLFMEPHRSYLSGHDQLVDAAMVAAKLDPPMGPTAWALQGNVYQLNVFVGPQDEGPVLAATSNLKLTRWSPNFADAMPADGGKAVGVRAALARYGLTPEQAVAFGDGGNDAEMFGAVGTSVAMGNAAQAVKELTTYTTDSVDEDGIWNGCRRLGLI